MKGIQLTSTYKPYSLILQIEPTNGELCEASLVCMAEVGGHTFRHDIWWKDMPEEWRTHAQALINQALDSVLNEQVIHATGAEHDRREDLHGAGTSAQDPGSTPGKGAGRLSGQD